MRLRNSGDLTDEEKAAARKRQLLIGGGALFVIIIVLLSIMSAGRDQTALKETELRYDSNSGDTVSDPAGKTPDTYGTLADAPIFLGFERLVGEGVTIDQLNSLKYAFYQYGKTAKLNLKEVSVSVDTVSPVPHDRFSSSTVDKINFNAILDQKTKVKVTLEYWEFESIRLLLHDSTAKKLLYDSGEVRNKSLQTQ